MSDDLEERQCALDEIADWTNDIRDEGDSNLHVKGAVPSFTLDDTSERVSIYIEEERLPSDQTP